MSIENGLLCLRRLIAYWLTGRLLFSNISSKASELGVCPYTGQWLEIESNMRWLSKTYTYNIIFHTNGEFCLYLEDWLVLLVYLLNTLFTSVSFRP
ncbi:hypothetical protein IC575_016723 [Cucumis melo]